jgi:hypothetical protein
MLGSGMKKRLAVALLIGCVSGILCWLIHLGPDPDDFRWALGAAQDIVHGRDPYAYSFSARGGPYPLTAVAFSFPFVWVRLQLAGALFFGLSSGLLAFGLTNKSYTPLLVFLAFPYWTAMLCVQWSPLVMAAALFPWLLPATLAKPQIGIPVLLTHCTWRGAAACSGLAIASLFLMPKWPLRWLSQTEGWPHYVPFLVLPLGPLIALSLWRRTDPDAHLLLLASLTPQHWFFDSFILWLIPKTRREILATCLLSWGAGWWRIYHLPRSREEFGAAAVGWIYLPMLALILSRSDATRLAVREQMRLTSAAAE